MGVAQVAGRASANAKPGNNNTHNPYIFNTSITSAIFRVRYTLTVISQSIHNPMPTKILPIVDCRHLTAFCEGHHQNACSLPAAELPERMHELPKTSEPIILYGDTVTLLEASAFLQGKGYQVAQQIEWTPSVQAALQATGELARGAHSQRLWQPAPLIARFVAELAPAHGITPGTGLDIGCGAGRDMVYLAMHGWQMCGIDYIPAALQRAQNLAVRHQVGIQTECLNLETGSDPFSAYASGQFELINVARYLHRPLFPWMKRLLKPGGVLIYQTFMQGSEQFGSPRNPNFLLKPGELAQVFTGAEILLDAVETLDDGRPVSAFIARL
jgi:SAM-dependent methyltransferase